MSKFERSQRDTNLLILSMLSDVDLISYCNTEKYANQLCQDESLWLNRLMKKFPVYKHYKLTDKTWREYYSQLVYYLNRDNFNDANDAIEAAATYGMKNLDVLQAIMFYWSVNWKRSALAGIRGALKGNHLDLADLFYRRAEKIPQMNETHGYGSIWQDANKEAVKNTTSDNNRVLQYLKTKE